jgi:hypothetical protein
MMIIEKQSVICPIQQQVIKVICMVFQGSYGLRRAQLLLLPGPIFSGALSLTLAD